MALFGPLIEKYHNIPKLPRSSEIMHVKFQKSLMTGEVMTSSQPLCPNLIKLGSALYGPFGPFNRKGP